MKLFSYFRSSAAFRVRIALGLKGLPYDYISVHLLRGEQQQADYQSLNPEGLVPALEHGGEVLTQSMAIMEYLDETHPEPPLLPGDALARAKVRALAQAIACDIHPLNNLRVLKYLTGPLGVDEAAKNLWYQHWTLSGLQRFEQQLLALDAWQLARGADVPRSFSWGAAPTVADCCLVPLIFNAQRFKVPLGGVPRTMAAFDACMALQAFQGAAPDACPDAQG